MIMIHVKKAVCKQSNGGVQRLGTCAKRVMNDHVNSDNSSGKSLGYKTIFIFSNPA